MRSLGPFFAAVVLLAQPPGRSTPMQTSLIPAFVYPISGAPLSVDITAERVNTPEGGVPTRIRETETVYRDGAGRLRSNLKGAAPEFEESGDIVSIVDTAGGFQAMLVPKARRAFRRTIPVLTSGASSTGVSLLGGPAVAVSERPGKRTVRTEALGKRVIEGIEFEGKLTTVTIEEEGTLVATDESWFSEELGLFALKVTIRPGSKTTSRIQKVSRAEPDPSLFVIPPDYVIEELPETAPTGR